MHYLYERRYFQGGLIFVQVKGVQTVDLLVRQIVQNMVVKVSTGDKNEIKKMVAKGPEVLLDYIISYINRTHESGEITPGH